MARRRLGERRPTATSRFGVSRRESHDAGAFYARFVAPEVSGDDHIEAPTTLDELVCGDARRMDRVADSSVALVVTSPPYFAGKEYEAALGEGGVPGTYLEYLKMLEEVFAECVRTLEPGGRIAVNVANLGRRPYRSLAADVTAILQDRLRLLLRGEIVWVKGRGATGSCAWGSYRSPANPVLRDLSERVVVASKGRFDRAVPPAARRRRGLPWEATITRDEFLEATTDVWEIPAERATRVGHPAPFPVELPARLIHLYTYRGDLVLDPFMGSGTTAVAALATGRHYVGYDTDPAYVAAARDRLELERARLAAAVTTDGTGPLPGPQAAETPGEATGEATGAAVAWARQALEAAGFRVRGAPGRIAPGVEVTFAAEDRRGGRWWFEVAGALTVVRPGLERREAVWRVLALAALAQVADPKVPLVVLSPSVPSPRRELGRLLAQASGPDRPLAAVIDLSRPPDRARLARLAAGGWPPVP